MLVIRKSQSGRGGFQRFTSLDPENSGGVASFTVLSQSEVRRRLGSLGVLAVSFFTLAFCQKPVQKVGQGPVDSHTPHALGSVAYQLV